MEQAIAEKDVISGKVPQQSGADTALNGVRADSNSGANAAKSAAPRGAWLLWTLLIIGIIVVVVAGSVQAYKNSRKVEVPKPVKDVPAFSLTDQTGKAFGSAQLAGHPYVIDFIFTRCGGQCPLMTVKMKQLQDWLLKNGYGDVHLVSVSVDPQNDTPEVLTKYANERFKVDTKNWTFLTGDRQQIFDLGIKGLWLAVDENKDAKPGEEFIHSEKFVLVDGDGKVRGYFNGTFDEAVDKVAPYGSGAETSSKPVEQAGLDKLRRTIEAMERERKK